MANSQLLTGRYVCLMFRLRSCTVYRATDFQFSTLYTIFRMVFARSPWLISNEEPTQLQREKLQRLFEKGVAHPLLINARLLTCASLWN